MPTPHSYRSLLAACGLFLATSCLTQVAAADEVDKKKKSPCPPEKIFAMKDSDNSGGLSKEELKVRIKRQPKDGKAPKAPKGNDEFMLDDVDLDKNAWNSLFEQADQNANGELDLDEWLLFRRLKRGVLFDRIDANGDKAISFKEMRKWLNRKKPDSELDDFEQGERRERQLKRFKKLDADDDGAISFEEFLAAQRWPRCPEAAVSQ